MVFKEEWGEREERVETKSRKRRRGQMEERSGGGRVEQRRGSVSLVLPVAMVVLFIGEQLEQKSLNLSHFHFITILISFY